MKSITFTVQIQADYPKGSRTKKAVALQLCHEINTILTKYDAGRLNQPQLNPARQPGSLPGCWPFKDKTVNPPNKPRTHLFSPHTDQCIYWGKSAQDDAIENTSCGCDEPPPCEACGEKGWLFCIAEGDHPPREEIHCCDACQKFGSDQAALEVVVKAAEAQPALLKFVQEIAELNHEKEPGEDGTVSDRPSEDYIATLNQLILDARQLLGTADKCEGCGAVVSCVIGCPDGTELCQDCFDAGQH